MMIFRNSFYTRSLWFVLLLSCICLTAQAQLISEALKENVKARVKNVEFPGLSIAVFDANKTEYFSHGKLVIGGMEEVDEQSIFEIGSISKTFTAVLLADQIIKGHMSLDDTLGKYLPDTLNIPNRKGKPITLRHMVTHTSGLSRMPSNFAPANPMNPYVDYSYEQMYEFLHGYTLRRNPGRGYLYSNYAMGLLGHLLELKTGKTYEALMQEVIARPLGMDDTFVMPTKEKAKRLAMPHQGKRIVSPWDIITLAGAGGIRSTTEDMVRYVKANLGLIETGLRDAMNQSHQTVITTTRDEKPLAMAWIYMNNDAQILWHNGGTGGFRTFIGFNKLTGKGVVVLSNSTAGVDDIGFHLLDKNRPLKAPN